MKEYDFANVAASPRRGVQFSNRAATERRGYST